MALSPSLSSSNSNIQIRGWVSVNKSNTVTRADVASFQHRKWNHICWTYSSISGNSIIYYNGGITKQEIFPTSDRRIWKGTDDTIESAFIIGQEPDQIRGQYEVDQLFNGDIAELNIWDAVLDNKMIFDMAKCNILPRGNIKA